MGSYIGGHHYPTLRPRKTKYYILRKQGKLEDRMLSLYVSKQPLLVCWWLLLELSLFLLRNHPPSNCSNERRTEPHLGGSNRLIKDIHQAWMRNDQDIGRFPVIGLPLAFENVIGCSLGFNKKFGCIALATTAVGVCLLTHFHFRFRHRCSISILLSFYWVHSM